MDYPPEPLQAVDGPWVIDAYIPTLLFQGQPVGYEHQQYLFLPNGSFRATNDEGDCLGWDGLSDITGEKIEMQLIVNSSMAVQSFLISSVNRVVANVSIVYSLMRSDGYDAGLKITIEGNVNWGSGEGIVRLKFTQQPSSVSTAMTRFRLDEGSGICFDWSDSLEAYSSSFNSQLNAVEWVVPNTFSIDPTIVSDPEGHPTAYDFQRKTIAANGYAWVFFTEGDSLRAFSSYDMGYTWDWHSAFFTGLPETSGLGCLSITEANGYVHQVIAKKNGTCIMAIGELLADGDVDWVYWNWSIALDDATPEMVLRPTIYVDGSGNHYYSFFVRESYGNYHLAVFRADQPDYTNDKIYDVDLDSDGSYNALVLGNGSTTVLLYGKSGDMGQINATYSMDGGESWSSLAQTYGSYDFGNSQAVMVGDTVYVAACDASNTYLLTFNVTSGSWGTPQLLDDASSFAGISTDGVSSLCVFYGNSTTVSSIISYDLGQTWINPITLTTSETDARYITMGPSFYSNFAFGIWTNGTGGSTGNSIRFSSLPVTVPNAATSENPWSQPGLSPYESYFAHESEFVSPGNGLLGIKQTDYLLAGRGLDLAITRVFSTPYAFTQGVPYIYDNYTATDLGLGWGLNLPWFGDNYFHLWDGQVYKLAWNGSVFENHKGTCFTLVNNSGDSYDLYSVSGTNYHFDSSKKLVSITDASGNNTISISYNGNGQISAIEDTVGREVAFCYNGNSQLATLVTGEGNWTYAYSGSNLASVTDPLGRTTSYQYNTGINSWLVSRVTYPTGGYTNYTYGSATVGTDVTTYYATLQNIYASESELSRSTSLSYFILNGEVLNCTTAVSDGFAVRSHTVLEFNGAQGWSSEAVTDPDGFATLWSKHIYDSGGRINETQVYSYTGALLATSSSQYDDWGNVISAVDYNGHQSWFSYANTNTSDSFPGSSGFTDSFYDQAINSYIHSLLLGQAECQNGTGTNLIEAYYLYDANGHLLQQKQLHDGGWILSNWTYDDYGNVLTRTDPLNAVTYFQYSPAYGSAYLTETSAMAGDQNVTTSYAYNFTNGALLTATDPMGNTTSYGYDEIGRVVCMVYPEVEGASANVTYLYNDTGNYLVSTDENGNSVKQVFDGLGRQVQVVRYNGSEVYSTENFTYNYLDKVATHTLPSGSAYSYTYDHLGRLTETGNPDGTSSKILYDDLRQTKTVIDANGLPGDPWWDLDYAYRIPITITGSSSGDVADYQFRIIAINGTGTSTSDTVYLDDMARADFGDIRFVDQNGTQAFDYWVQEKFDGMNATFWFKVSDTIAQSQDYTLYLYYRNPSATSISSSADTFQLYDDFNDSSINSTLWSTYSTSTMLIREQGGEMIVFGRYSSTWKHGGFRSTESYQYGCGYQVMMSASIDYGEDFTGAVRIGFVPTSTWDSDRNLGNPEAPSLRVYPYNDILNVDSRLTASYTQNVAEYVELDEMQLFEFRRAASISDFYINGENVWSTTTSTHIPTDTRAVGVDISIGPSSNQSASISIHVDWLAVRKYASPEPAVAIGSKQTQGAGTVYHYDWTSRLTWVRQLYGNGPTSYYQTDYAYDEEGNLVSVSDANTNATAYEYDDLNRLVLTSYPDETSQSITYDSLGNVIGKTDPMGRSINYTYDPLNRLTQVLYPDDGTVDYAYDANGNTLSVVEAETSTYYSYDARNRLANETDVIGGVSYTTLYSYDQAGNVLSITYPDETVVSYAYDALGRVSSAEGYASFTYTLTNRIDTVTFENGALTAYTYDLRGRPTRILTCSGETTLLDLNYTFDAVGNVLAINDEEYAYDALDRLTYGSGPWGTYNYTYDPAGNLLELEQNGDSTAFTYASYNRLTAMGDFDFTYDDNGNMLTKADGVEEWEYGYDFENRLANVTKDSQLIQTNQYSSDGRRVMATSGDNSIVYTYRGVSILYERNLTSGAEVDRIYAQGLMIAKLSSDVAHYYHQDVLGSVRLVTNPAVEITFGSNYVPFGTTVNTTGAEAFMYTGKPVDDITGLYYFGARFYDPSIHRFIAQDRNAGQIGDPISMNRYIYARDNPLAFKDPDGNNPISAISDWWGGLSTDARNATILTIGIIAAATITICSGGLGAPVGAFIIQSAAAGAAISSTAYTLSSGNSANPTGVVGAVVSGAIAGVAGGWAWSASAGYGAIAIMGGSVVGDLANCGITGESPDPINIGKNALISLGTLKLGNYFSKAIGLSFKGPPRYFSATKSSTLIEGVFHPSIRTNTAYQMTSTFSGFALTQTIIETTDFLEYYMDYCAPIVNHSNTWLSCY